MSDYAVLSTEPRYKVDAFVDELTERARAVISEMGAQLESLLRSMLDQFSAYKLAHYLITLKDVRFADTRWHSDGRLILSFTTSAPRENDPEMPRHIDVDNFVKDVVQRTVPQEFHDECVSFLRPLIFQFALIRKHTGIDLRDISFSIPEWISDSQLAIQVSRNDKPFTPKEARF